MFTKSDEVYTELRMRNREMSIVSSIMVKINEQQNWFFCVLTFPNLKTGLSSLIRGGTIRLWLACVVEIYPAHREI